jgi:hypothetical protein
LVLNYQLGAWLLAHQAEPDVPVLMPQRFLLIAHCSCLSPLLPLQALITGLMHLPVVEVIRLNMWPAVKLNYPTDRGTAEHEPPATASVSGGVVTPITWKWPTAWPSPSPCLTTVLLTSVAAAGTGEPGTDYLLWRSMSSSKVLPAAMTSFHGGWVLGHLVGS